MSKIHVVSVAEAVLVTFLWSTSYILIEWGLEEINPLAFATYRYAIASIILSIPMFYIHRKRILKHNLRRNLMFLIMGFTGYFTAQGLQFLGLFYLQPVTVSFLLNLTPVFVLAFGFTFLSEKPTRIQLAGLILSLCGVFAFFYGTSQDLNFIGILLTLISGVGWAAYMIISRHYLSKYGESVITLTAFSMAAGAIMLLGTTAYTGNIVPVSPKSWIIILWLSVMNTALAFALWNHALKTLRAYEQSILQNTMLIQIALLSFIFLHNPLNLQKILGMVMVFIGVLIVQYRPRS